MSHEVRMGAGKGDTANGFSWCRFHEVFILQIEHGIIKSQRSSLLQDGCFNCTDVHRSARTLNLNKYLLVVLLIQLCGILLASSLQ